MATLTIVEDLVLPITNFTLILELQNTIAQK